MLDFKLSPEIKHKDVYLCAFDAMKKSTYSNQTGITTSKGHKYIMMAVELDGNYIDAEPMKLWSAKELIHAYQSILAGRRLQVLYAPISMCLTMKHLRSTNKQFMRIAKLN